jgi:hypothetical protein
MGQQCKCNLRRFGNAKDLGSLHLDPRTVGDSELSIAKRLRELPLIHDPEYVFVRVVAPSKYPDRLRDKRCLDPFADSEPLSIHRRDGLVPGWSPLLRFYIRLYTLGPGRWSWSGRIIALHGIVVVLHLAVQYGLKVYCGCPSETPDRESQVLASYTVILIVLGRSRREGLDHLLIVLSSQELFDAGVEAILKV